MPAKTQLQNKTTLIHTLPTSIPKTHIETYLQKSQQNPLGTWLILPTKHLAKYLKQEIQKDHNQTILPGHITTLRELAQTICKTVIPTEHVITEYEQQLIIQTILAQNINSQKLSPNGKPGIKTIQNLITLKKNIAQNTTELKPKTEKLKLLKEILDSYHKTLQQKNLLDEETAIQKAIEILSASKPTSKTKLNTLILCYLHDPMEIERLFIETLKQNADESITLQAYADNPSIFPDAERNIRDELKQNTPEAELSAGLFAGPKHIIPDSCNLICTQYQTAEQEINAVFEKISELLENGALGKDILIISPNVSETILLADELIGDFSIKNPDGSRTKLTYKTSAGGRPLIHYPMVQGVITLLSTPLSGYKKEDLISLLSIPSIGRKFNIFPSEFIRYAEETKSIQGKNTWLTLSEKRSLYLTAELKTAEREEDKERIADKILKLQTFQENLNEFIRYLESFEKGKLTIRGHSERLLQTIKDLSLLPKTKTYDNAAVYEFSKIIEEVSSSVVGNSGEFSESGYLETITNLARMHSLKNPHEPEETVTISGLREAAHTKAKHVFIVNLTSSAIPRVEMTFPFLTMDETAALRKKDLKQYIITEKFYFLAALLTASESLHLSAPEKSENSYNTPSPFFMRFPNINKISEENLSRNYHSLTENQIMAGEYIRENRSEGETLFGVHSHLELASRAGVELIDRKGVVTNSGYMADFSEMEEIREEFLEKYSDEKTFSPTMLEKYAKCPFAWYLEKHLKLKLPPNPGNEESLALGNVVHKIMHRFFAEFQKPISEENEYEARELILKIGSEEFSKIQLTSPYWRSMVDLYLKGVPAADIQSIFFEVLDKEKKYFGSFSNQLLEESVEPKLGVPIPDSVPLKLKGYADRVDITDDNKVTVIDYKTGRMKKEYRHDGIANGYSLQLPLYLAALKTENQDFTPKNGHYYQISPRKVSITKPFEVKNLPDISEQIDAILKICDEYRKGMQNGVCTPNEKNPEVNKYCPFRYICRYEVFEEEE